MINLWGEKRQVDWISVVLLMLFPVALFFLIKDRQRKLQNAPTKKKPRVETKGYKKLI